MGILFVYIVAKRFSRSAEEAFEIDSLVISWMFYLNRSARAFFLAPFFASASSSSVSPLCSYSSIVGLPSNFVTLQMFKHALYLIIFHLFTYSTSFFLFSSLWLYFRSKQTFAPWGGNVKRTIGFMIRSWLINAQTIGHFFVFVILSRRSLIYAFKAEDLSIHLNQMANWIHRCSIQILSVTTKSIESLLLNIKPNCNGISMYPFCRRKIKIFWRFFSLYSIKAWNCIWIKSIWEFFEKQNEKKPNQEWIEHDKTYGLSCEFEQLEWWM